MQRQLDSSLLFFAAGCALGAAIGLMLAPQSGRDTRQHLTARGRQVQDRFGESGREYLERGRELYDQAREMADEAAAMFEEGRRLIEEQERAEA